MGKTGWTRLNGDCSKSVRAKRRGPQVIGSVKGNVMGTNKNLRGLILGAVILLGAACASSPTNRIESQLIKLGIPQGQASCLSGELNENLDRDQLSSVANLLDGVNASDSPGQTLDVLLSIDDPLAAASIASAGISCALEQAFG